MIKSAQNYAVSSILDSESKIHYLVPRYQREYVWKKTHWEDLFDDIWDNAPGHFLGSIICINRSEDSLRSQNLEVIDGQQRLTTLSLLYAAIYIQCNTMGDTDDEMEHELYNLKHRLILKGGNQMLRVTPSYQNKNFQDYKAILERVGILQDVEQSLNMGNRRLFKAYRYFEERLCETDGSGSRVFTLEIMKQLIEKVNAASLVKIEVNSHSDAYVLFESLNNRGEPLSALDLIKNKMLATLEKKRPGSIDDNFRKWNMLLENLTDDYATQERYLRQYYNAFKYKEETSVKGYPFATKSNIIQIYEKLIDKDATRIFDELFTKSKLYNQFIVIDDAKTSTKIARQYRDLDRIGGAPAHVLLLYLLAERPNSDIEAICEFLVKFFVRRSMTDQPPTRDLGRIFVTVIDTLRAKPRTDTIKVIQDLFHGNGWIASDAIFRSKLEGNIYEDNVDTTRFILCKIEESKQTKERFTDLWKRDSNRDYIWTIEHILPKGQNIPDEWVQMIAGGDKEKAKALLDQHVHKMGNLTITGYNSRLGTKSFVEKRDRKDSQGNKVGYKNGLFLNAQLATSKAWTIADIEARTKLLVTKAIKLFSIK